MKSENVVWHQKGWKFVVRNLIGFGAKVVISTFSSDICTNFWIVQRRRRFYRPLPPERSLSNLANRTKIVHIAVATRHSPLATPMATPQPHHSSRNYFGA